MHAMNNNKVLQASNSATRTRVESCSFAGELFAVFIVHVNQFRIVNLIHLKKNLNFSESDVKISADSFFPEEPPLCLIEKQLL